MQQNAKVKGRLCAACVLAILVFMGSNASAKEMKSVLTNRSRKPIANPTMKPPKSAVAMVHASVASATATNDQTIRKNCFTGNTANVTISLANAVVAKYVLKIKNKLLQLTI